VHFGNGSTAKNAKVDFFHDFVSVLAAKGSQGTQRVVFALNLGRVPLVIQKESMQTPVDGCLFEAVQKQSATA